MEKWSSNTCITSFKHSRSHSCLHLCLFLNGWYQNYSQSACQSTDEDTTAPSIYTRLTQTMRQIESVKLCMYAWVVEARIFLSSWSESKIYRTKTQSIRISLIYLLKYKSHIQCKFQQSLSSSPAKTTQATFPVPHVTNYIAKTAETHSQYQTLLIAPGKEER